MAATNAVPRDYRPADGNLLDDEITPSEAPTIGDSSVLGPKLFQHNALLLLDLMQKESGDASANMHASLGDITSNKVVWLLSRQKLRRCKQIHDERLGKSCPAGFEARARLRFDDYQQFGAHLDEVLPPSSCSNPSLPWSPLDEVKLVLAAHDEYGDYDHTGRFDLVDRELVISAASETQYQPKISLSLLNSLSIHFPHAFSGPTDYESPKNSKFWILDRLAQIYAGRCVAYFSPVGAKRVTNDEYVSSTDSLEPPWSNFQELKAQEKYGIAPTAPTTFTTGISRESLKSLNNIQILASLKSYQLMSFIENIKIDEIQNMPLDEGRSRCVELSKASSAGDSPSTTVACLRPSVDTDTDKIPNLEQILKESSPTNVAPLITERRSETARPSMAQSQSRNQWTHKKLDAVDSDLDGQSRKIQGFIQLESTCKAVPQQSKDGASLDISQPNPTKAVIVNQERKRTRNWKGLTIKTGISFEPDPHSQSSQAADHRVQNHARNVPDPSCGSKRVPTHSRKFVHTSNTPTPMLAFPNVPEIFHAAGIEDGKAERVNSKEPLRLDVTQSPISHPMQPNGSKSHDPQGAKELFFNEANRPFLHERMSSPVIRGIRKDSVIESTSTPKECIPHHGRTHGRSSYSPQDVFTDRGLYQSLQNAQASLPPAKNRTLVSEYPTHLPIDKPPTPNAHKTSMKTLPNVSAKHGVDKLNHIAYLGAEESVPHLITDRPSPRLLPPSPPAFRVPHQDNESKGYLEGLSEFMANLTMQRDHAHHRAVHAEEMFRQISLERQQNMLHIYQMTHTNEMLRADLARLEEEYKTVAMNLNDESERRIRAEERCQLWEENFQSAVQAGSELFEFL